MKTLTAIFLAIVLFGCTEKRNSASAPLQSKPVSVTKSADTLPGFSKLNFFALYKLSPKTTAIVIPLHDKDESPPTFFDTLVNQLKYPEPGSLMPIGSHYVDTSGEYRLLKVDTLSQRVRHHIAPFYFVYGTRGAAKVTISEVLLALDECKTNFIALTISTFDTANYGTPSLCSDKPLNIDYKGNYTAVEKQIAQLQKAAKSDYEYLDKIPIKVFGHVGSMFLAFSDDFLWERAKGGQKCFFPSRHIFMQEKNGHLKQYWAESLDLFGIPCD